MPSWRQKARQQLGLSNNPGWSIKDCLPGPLGRCETVEAVEEVMRIGDGSGPAPLEPNEPGYPFQALVDAVTVHVEQHGGRFRIAEGSVTYPSCGHCLPAAIAIEVTNLDEARTAEKARDGFIDLASQPCPECARLAKAT